MDTLRYAIAAGGLALTAMSAGAQSIPSGQMPPAGLCRVWIDGVAAARQPHATDCATARRSAPVNSHIVYGGNAHLRTGVANQYDPRADPRSPQYDPRYDPNANRNDPRNGTYDPRNGTYDPRNGTYDPRHDGRRNGNHADRDHGDGDHGDGDDDDDDDNDGNNRNNRNHGVYDPRQGTIIGNGTYDSRMNQKDRAKWEQKREKELRKHNKGNHDRNDRDDDDR